MFNHQGNQWFYNNAFWTPLNFSREVEHKDWHFSFRNALLCIKVYQKHVMGNQMGVLFGLIDELRHID